MTTTKTIKITGQEILEHYVSVSEDCTIAEARDIILTSLVTIEQNGGKVPNITISYEK